MRPTCSTCRWFLASPDINLTSNAPHGECRRMPTTKRGFWCGEHAPMMTVAGNAA